MKIIYASVGSTDQLTPLKSNNSFLKTNLQNLSKTWAFVSVLAEISNSSGEAGSLTFPPLSIFHFLLSFPTWRLCGQTDAASGRWCPSACRWSRSPWSCCWRWWVVLRAASGGFYSHWTGWSPPYSPNGGRKNKSLHFHTVKLSFTHFNIILRTLVVSFKVA